MKKIALILGLIFLSIGAFAQSPTQLYTIIYFKTMPSRPPTANPNDNSVKITITYYFNDRPSETYVKDVFYMAANGHESITFPGDYEKGSHVTSTKIDLSFYGNTTGTGKTFPGLPAIVTATADFSVQSWWILVKHDPGATDRSSGSPQYSAIQSPNPPQ